MSDFTPQGDINLRDVYKVEGVVDPTENQDAATKKYVDDKIVENITVTAPLILNGDDISIPVADTTTDGYLSSTDWNIFTNKVSSQWTTTGDDIYYNLGRVGIGMNNPGSLLELGGDSGLTLSGNSRVKKCFYIDADAIKAPGAKPASFVEDGLSGSWEFSNEIEANQQSISGNVKIPHDADRTVSPTFNIGIYVNGVSPGITKWQFEYLYVGENSDMTASAQETLTATKTASATSNGLTILTFTGINLPSSTDKAMIWKLTRLSADTEDTISASVFLKGIFIEYTANKLGESL